MKRIYLILLFVFFSFNIYAITVKLRVNPKVAYRGVPFNVEVVVSGLADVSGSFRLKTARFFSIQRAGISQKYSLYNVGGKIKRVFAFGENFSLIPKRTGRFLIGPGVFTYKGKNYSTGKVHIKVRKQAAYRNLIKRQQRGFFSDFFSSRQRREQTQPLKYFGEYSLSTKTCFVNEEVVLNLDLYINIDRVRFIRTANRTLVGFWEDKAGDSALEGPVEVKKNGETWYRYRKALAHLFPTSPGKKIIPAVKAFFALGMRRLSFKMDPISLQVKRLPQSALGNFKGDVGQYSISLKLLQKQFIKNQPFEIDVFVVGKGNIGSISDPLVNIISNNFRVLSPKGAISINHDKETVGPEVAKRFRYTVYPLQEGKRELPIFKLVFFDPAKNKYVEIKTQKEIIEVLPELKNSVVSDASLKQHNIEDKIVYKVSVDAVDTHLLFMSPSLLIFIFSILVLLLIIQFFIYRRKLILLDNPSLFLKSRAYGEGSGAFSLASKSLKNSDFYSALGFIEKGLKKFVLRKLGKEGDNVLISALEADLVSHGVSPEVIRELSNLIEDCSSLRYGMEANEVAVKSLLDKSQKMIKKMEQLWK